MNPKENLIRVINFEQPDHIPWFMTMKQDDPFDEGSFQRLPYKGAFPPQAGGIDIWGIEWQATDTKLNLPYPIMHPLNDINKLEDYKWPDPEDPALMEPVIREMDSSRLMLGTHGLTLMERAHSITGMEALFTILASNKEEARQLLRKIADFQIRMAENFVSLGVDGAWCSDDYGAQNSMLISPAMFREFFKPLLSEIFQVYKRAGLFVFFHSCGHIEPIVPDIIEIGADVLHPVQMRSNDQEMLKREFGDQIVFAGGMDTQYTLTQGSPGEVRAEAIKQIQTLGGDGGYIAGPENWPPFPVQNAKAFAETMSKYGRYPLHRNLESIVRTRQETC
jgi:uroporphyrinogen decarboxylase